MKLNRYNPLVYQVFLFLMALIGVEGNCTSVSSLPKDFPQEQAVKDAQALLNHGVRTVMDKALAPPSGDKHDWVTQAPYWWPDRAHPFGPYIRQDGKRNPEIDRWTDDKYFSDMLRTTEVLSQGYIATQDEIYAKRTAEILRSWFIDEATKMNPNLDYGQFVPGRSQGRGEGIISTRFIYKVPQIIHRIENSKYWSDHDREVMKTWFADYYEWLTRSRIGVEETHHVNNHLTWYLVQKASLEIELNRIDDAKKTLNFVVNQILPAQVKDSGLQPKELERTKSFSYSSMNLNAFWVLAYLGKSIGVDFMSNPNGALLFKATDALLPYDNLSSWPYRQITSDAGKEFCRPLYWVQLFSSDPKYQDAQDRFGCPSTVESYFIKNGL